jgi:hypothetical protein
VTFSDGNAAHNQVVTITNGVATASTVNLSGLTDGPITATLAASDAAGNTFSASANATLDQDAGEQAALSVAFNTTTITAGQANAVPFTVGGLEADDSAVVTFKDHLGATRTASVSGDGTATVNLSGLAGGTITASMQVAPDAAGNTFVPVNASNSATLQTSSPTVAVTTNNTDVNLAHGTATITFTFGAAPAAFVLGDTSATGGILTNLQKLDVSHYSATFTAAANTDISNASVSVTAGSWHDVNGNAGGGGSTTFTVDTVKPTVAVAIGSNSLNLAHNSASVTFAFSEAPVAFVLGDTSATGGTLSNLQKVDATHYSATFTAAANTDISNASVSVVGGSWQEGNGNPGTGGTTGSFTVDTTDAWVNGAIGDWATASNWGNGPSDRRGRCRYRCGRAGPCRHSRRRCRLWADDQRSAGPRFRPCRRTADPGRRRRTTRAKWRTQREQWGLRARRRNLACRIHCGRQRRRLPRLPRPIYRAERDLRTHLQRRMARDRQ